MPVEKLWDLRMRMLRPDQTVEASQYPGDDAADSAHFGAFADDRLLGVATLHREPLDAEPAWRLRGMAVEHDAHGLGVGRRLLEAVNQHVSASGSALLWCHARSPAVGFYERCGWRVISDEYEIPGVGPHRKMTREV